MPILLSASTRGIPSHDEIMAQRSAVRSGSSYIFEIAYPLKMRDTLDPTRCINGCVMIVATMELYVHNVNFGGDYIEYTCSGRDRYNGSADGKYYFYQSDLYMRGDRPFVLSVFAR